MWWMALDFNRLSKLKPPESPKDHQMSYISVFSLAQWVKSVNLKNCA